MSDTEFADYFFRRFTLLWMACGISIVVLLWLLGGETLWKGAAWIVGGGLAHMAIAYLFYVFRRDSDAGNK